MQLNVLECFIQIPLKLNHKFMKNNWINMVLRGFTGPAPALPLPKPMTGMNEVKSKHFVMWMQQSRICILVIGSREDNRI